MNGNVIYHVCFGGNGHHYFGSISAIFDKFTPDVLGVTKEALWKHKLTAQNPFKNDVCSIDKGFIHRKPGNRARGKETPKNGIKT